MCEGAEGNGESAMKLTDDAKHDKLSFSKCLALSFFLAVANFFYAAIAFHNWFQAGERSLFQAAALLIAVMV